MDREHAVIVASRITHLIEDEYELRLHKEIKKPEDDEKPITVYHAGLYEQDISTPYYAAKGTSWLDAVTYLYMEVYEEETEVPS